MVNKKGWIRIVEAFIAILLITLFLLIIVNKGYVERNPGKNNFYEEELSILKILRLDNSLRQAIIEIDSELEMGEAGFPSTISNKISEETPSNLECSAKICALSSDCVLSEEINSEIYAKSAVFSATLTTYNPKQLKLFCWEI